MNAYTIGQLAVGHSESFAVTVTEAMMQGFLRATGDTSPIHVDEAAAAQRGYPGRVVYGMLCAGLFSTLAGVHLPGATCLLHGVEAKFAKPVFIGDELTVTGTVTEVNTTFSTIVVKAAITNQRGEKVTRGVIKAGVAEG